LDAEWPVKGLDRLLEVLGSGGLWRGEEIQRKLGISQPVMSRLVREAGVRICRFGRSVATQYALPREIVGLGQNVPVFRVDESGRPHRHGGLHFLTGGGTWLKRETGGGQAFSGLPPFVEDMRPQGYIGRGFPALYPELRLPERINDWGDDHQLIALAMRGEDCVGNLLIGENSLDRLNAGLLRSFSRAEFTSLAEGALTGQPGSSAGGEHPKFAVFSEGRHVLVKFASGDGAAADRWRDLLICEHLALEMLRKTGVPVPRSEWFDLDGIRFLETERFDRIGARGRRGVISLSAINSHFLGDYPDTWSRASKRILDEPFLAINQTDVERMIWLDTFGGLIGNTDRHYGNMSFFAEEGRGMNLTLAPVYDMLPMVFAPMGTTLVERTFAPEPPTALNLHLWHEVANHALIYWSQLSETEELSQGFRKTALNCRDALARFIQDRP